ncbi:hypothetical protein SLE2022_219480 [Rubroshorea leprosula]
MNHYHTSSAVFSLRTKGSLPFSFNDYSNLCNARFDKYPLSSSSCCSCCCCCACCATSSHHRVSINPSFLYGLRQSALIQWSPSRRLVLGGGDRYFHRFPNCDIDEGSYDVHCSYRGRKESAGFRRRSNRRFRCIVSEERNGSYGLDGVDYAEAVISLLSEEVGEEGLGIGERNRSLCKKVEGERRNSYDSKGSSERKKRVEVEKRRDLCSECYSRKKKIVEVKERGNKEDECNRSEKKNGGLGLFESESRHHYESVATESREEKNRRNKEKEASLRVEHCKGRTKSSSCTSYYSFSSAQDLDAELLDHDEQLVEDSLSGYENESIRYENIRIEGQMAEGFKGDHDEAGEHEEVLECRNNAGGTIIDWDLRKKSEKKLAELSVEEIQSREKSSQEYSRMAKTDESDNEKRSRLHKHLDDGEKKQILDQGTRRQYTQVNNQLKGQSESRSKYQDARETSKIHSSSAEMTSQSQKQFSGIEEHLTVGAASNWETRTEHLKRGAHVAEKEDLRRDNHSAMSAIQDVPAERISTSKQQSDTRLKIQKEDSTLFQTSVQQTTEQHQQRDEGIISQLDLRRKLEHSSEIAGIHDSNNKKISILQSETGRKKQEDSSSLVPTSFPESEQHFQTDKKSHRRIEMRKEPQDVWSVSVFHAKDTEMVTSSQSTSVEGMIEQESKLKPAVRLIEETKERHSEANEAVKQIQSRRVAQKKPDSPSTSQEKAKESSGFEASRILISQSRKENIDVDEMKKRSTQVILVPPPSQLLARGSRDEDPTTRIVNQGISGETSEGGSNASYMHSSGRTTALHINPPARARMIEAYRDSLNLTTHEDSLGSAHRLEESSTHFVGDFIEKAGHEISTSETTFAHQDDEHAQDSSGKYESEDPKTQGHDSRQSSQGSRAKGPSDEMWDVTETSVQEPTEVEVPEGNSTGGNAVVKRSGRSLWTLMADIVRLRWVSHSQTPSSAARSGGRTSPIESTGSEAWFSSHEQDDNTVDTLRRKRSGVAQGATSFQSETGKTSLQGQVELSDTMRSRDKIRLPEESLTSSSNKLEIVSASERISLSSTNENQDGDHFQITPAGREEAESSLPLPPRSMRSPVVEEISEGPTLVVASGSEVKSGDLKPRKLQRSKQVLKDRFDEWEEAYKLESEQRKMDEIFMREALLEANKAADTWEVPVGAVLVQHGKIIARGCNLVEELRDSTAHAEMICIREASNILHSWRLVGTTLYVTLEPCPMCAGAILQARIDTLVWGAPNKLLGADGSWMRLFPDGGEQGNGAEPSDKPPAPVHPFHPKMTIRRGVLATECADVMQQFFQLRRRKKVKEEEDDPPPPPSCLPISNHPSKVLTKVV